MGKPIAFALALLAGAAGPTPAQVRVLPEQATLLPGGSCTFTFEAPQGASSPARWLLLEGPGTLDARTGRFEAPGTLEDTALTRIEVEVEGAGQGDAVAVLLPWAQPALALVTRVLGPGWVEPYRGTLPFLDRATGQRMASGRVGVWKEVRTAPIRAAVGIPIRLVWDPDPKATAQLLTWNEDGETHYRDMTGRSSCWVTFQGRAGFLALESLVPLRKAGHYLSWTQYAAIDLRGVIPFPGGAGLGSRASSDPSERLAEPYGMALVPCCLSATFPQAGDRLVVADRAAHAIRILAKSGKVRTLCGVPFQAGHRDSPTLWDRLGAWICGRPGREPLFRGPTHVAVRCGPHPDFAWRPHRWELLVADSGNHVIRKVEDTGWVSTLAGRPGKAGYRDGDHPLQACFSDPQGLAVDEPTGGLYVADRGNRVIRRVDREGRVRTCAGSPGNAEPRDAARAAAGFHAPSALTLDLDEAGRKVLWVLDGHALRRMDLATFEVTTWLGVPGTPGWKDFPLRGTDTRLQPCLNSPTALVVLWTGNLAIADGGNRAIRSFQPRGKLLVTVAGGPDLPPGTRPGLLRRRLGPPLDDRFATLEPRSVLEMNAFTSRLVVTSGSSVVACFPDGDGPSRIHLEAVTVAPGAQEGSAEVEFRTRVPGRAQPCHLVATVDLLDLEGQVCARREVGAWSGERVTVRVDHSCPPEGTLVLRCLAEDGQMAEHREPFGSRAP